MSHAEAKIVARKRAEFGKGACRRLRRDRIVPGNVYGHQKDAIPISASEDNVEAMVRGGHKVVDLDIEGSVEKAMFREVQWDTFGRQIQHFDLIRIDADERVTVEVGIELRGNAPGVAAGGVIEQHLRELQVECLALEIPDHIVVRIHELEIGGVIHVRDLKVPEGVTVLTDPDEVVVALVQPVEIEEEPAAAELGPAEPELIGRKPTEEEEPE
jgi:large subunit ribosomal protein L25